MKSRTATTTKESELRYKLTTLPDNLSPGQEIIQGFIIKGDGLTVRIRKTTDIADPNVVAYVLTVKDGKGRDKTEHSTCLTSSAFIKLANHLVKDSVQRKIRRFRDRWVIDQILEGEHEGDVVAEYELESGESEPNIPDDFQVEKQLQ